MSLTIFSLLSFLVTLSLHFVASNNITPFIPNGEEPPEGWPYVVAFEGAAYHAANSDKYGKLVAQYLLPKNIAVIAVSYDQLTWPSGYEEQILGLMEQVASAKQLNSERMGCIGESAGGWIASTIGLKNPNGTDRVKWTVKAVGDYYGPTDLSGLYLEHKANGSSFDHVIMQDLIEFLGEYDKSVYDSASPIFWVTPESPPFFLAQGGQDKTVFYWNSNELYAALQRNDIFVNQTIIQNCTHGFDPNGVAYNRPDWYCHKNMSDPKEVNLGNDMADFFEYFLSQ